MTTQAQRSTDLSTRSLMELRRLAYRAKRSAAAREVLHDALLETFPLEYSDVIRRAQNQTKRKAQHMAHLHRDSWRPPEGSTHFVERYVVFHPRYLKYVTPSGRKLYPNWTKRKRASILFTIETGWQLPEHPTDVEVYESKTPIRYRR